MVTGFAELVASLASLLWPLVVVWAVLLFRSEIRAAISRINKAKILGNEFELNPKVKQLSEVADQASTEVQELPSIPSATDAAMEPDHAAPVTNDITRNILAVATQSPRLALLRLSAEIEKEGTDVLASVGKLKKPDSMSLSGVIARLDSHYGLPRYIPSSVRLFADVRNQILHGRLASEQDMLSALDSGITIYKALRSLPRELNWVHHQGVPVYSDESCEHEISGVKGVILKTESPGGASSSFRIFPSTRTHYRVGHRVSWEWDTTNVWGNAWYRDPDTNQVTKAWDQAGEFVGRHLHELRVDDDNPLDRWTETPKL